MRQTALKQACTNFLGGTLRKPKASVVSLEFLAMGNQLQIVENRTELAEIKQTQGLPFRHFINNV